MIPEPAIDRLSAMFRSPDVSGTRYELVSVLGRGGMGVVDLIIIGFFATRVRSLALGTVFGLIVGYAAQKRRS